MPFQYIGLNRVTSEKPVSTIQIRMVAPDFGLQFLWDPFLNEVLNNLKLTNWKWFSPELHREESYNWLWRPLPLCSKPLHPLRSQFPNLLLLFFSKSNTSQSFPWFYFFIHSRKTFTQQPIKKEGLRRKWMTADPVSFFSFLYLLNEIFQSKELIMDQREFKILKLGSNFISLDKQNKWIFGLFHSFFFLFTISKRVEDFVVRVCLCVYMWMCWMRNLILSFFSPQSRLPDTT